MTIEVTDDRTGPREQRQCLLVALGQQPVLALVAECPHDEFSLDGRVYRDKGYGAWTGFYDWLRDRHGQIVGLRYWPFEETRFLTDSLRALPYVRVDEDRSFVEFYLADARAVDHELSDDQHFGDNRLFATDSGELGISFGTETLSEPEMDHVRALVASNTPGIIDAPR